MGLTSVLFASRASIACDGWCSRAIPSKNHFLQLRLVRVFVSPNVGGTKSINVCMYRPDSVLTDICCRELSVWNTTIRIVHLRIQQTGRPPPIAIEEMVVVA
jgi:hypothetical protein